MADHPVLAANPTLAEIQAYMAAVVKHRGFDKETLQDSFILLTEEVGELAKALRKHEGRAPVATDSTIGAIEHEAADVFWMLICVCNHLGIDLETALRDKEEINKQRRWE
ncbi:MAG TPA: MazG nucleotide pyrophosphohydrolase domain-containing protein [Candidatus Saccharimonadales bacterium]|nr:MazG nucleotide pyrophosphohydrolase domain-containing protein [Candidatus Saccharimonadales bacterium]